MLLVALSKKSCLIKKTENASSELVAVLINNLAVRHNTNPCDNFGVQKREVSEAAAKMG